MGTYPWASFLGFERGKRKFGAASSSTFGVIQMKQHLIAYAWFVGFAIATKILVVPVAKSMNLPYIQDL